MINWLIKIVQYEWVKVTIKVSRLVKFIINIAARHYGLPDFNVTDRGSLFTLKFWLLH